MASREVVVLSAVRSPIGAFGGSLADFDTSELAGLVMKEAIARSTVDPQLINYVTVGTTMPTDSRYAYASRVASIQAGLSMESVAMQVSRLCPICCTTAGTHTPSCSRRWWPSCPSRPPCGWSW